MKFHGTARRSCRKAIGLAAGLLALTRAGEGDVLPAFHEPITPIDVRLEWRRGVFGPNIGGGGLRVVDLDRNGTMEIVAGPGSGYGGTFRRWWIAAHGPGAPELTWVSPWYEQSITGLVVSNVDGDSAREVLVATDTRVLVYDGVTRTIQGTIEVPGIRARHLQVSDLDRDGRRELILCADGADLQYPYAGRAALYVYDLLTGAQVHADTAVLTLPPNTGEACTSLDVGNVDGDPAPEIVVANGGGAGYVLDGVTRSVQWANGEGFGRIVRVADLDRDGQGDIVAASPLSDRINVFDAVRHTLVQTVAARAYVMEVLDVDGDGFLEVVHGDGSLHVRSTPGLQEEWSVAGQGEIGGIAAGDTDGDGTRELVFGTGGGFQGRLFVVDPVTRTVEARGNHARGPFYGLAHGVLEGAGRPSLVHTAFEADELDGWPSRGRYFVHGTRRWRQRYVNPPATEPGIVESLMRVRVANLDDDVPLEVAVGGGEAYSPGTVACYDGLTRALQWRVTLASPGAVASLAVGDVDGDGAPEVVAGGSAEGGLVVVLDGRSGALKWRSPSFGGYDKILFLRLAQLDTDAALEIVAANQYPGSVYVLDAVERDVSALGVQDASALETADRDGDGRAEILIGTHWGDLRVIDSLTGAMVERIGLFGTRIDGLAVNDVNGDGASDYAFALGGRVYIVDGHTRAALWTSNRLGLGVGLLDSLLVADVDADGRLELVVNTGEEALDVYELTVPGQGGRRRHTFDRF